MKVKATEISGVLAAVFVVLAGGSGCAPAQSDPGPGAGTSAGTSGRGGASGLGGLGGQAGAGGQSGQGAGAFGVLIEASRTTLCPGECAQLTASAHDGRAPFSYGWSPDIGQGPGPHEVCPAEDTSYTVTAHDFALVDDEFGMASQEASAAIELRVRARCDEAQDAGTPDAAVDDETHRLCDVRLVYGERAWISSVTGWEGGANLVGDHAGNMYVAGGFGGAIEVAGTTLTSRGTTDSFVVKLDSACEVLWAIALGAPGAQVGLGAIGVGPDGDPVLAGALTGSLQHGSTTLTPGFDSTAVVLKLDGRDGSALWGQTFASLFHSTAVWDIGVDDEDAVVLSGYAAADVSFGAEPLGGPSGNVAFVAKLTGSGGHVFSEPVELSDLWLPIAVHPQGHIAVAGWATGGSEIAIGGGTVLITGTHWQRYAVLLDASGALQWSATFGAGDEREVIGWWGGGLAVDADRNVVVEHGGYEESVDGTLHGRPKTLTRVSSIGEVQWTQVMPYSAHLDYYAHGGIDTDSANNIVFVDEVEQLGVGPVMPGGDPIHSDVIVTKLEPDGDAIWNRRIGSALYEWSWGVAVDVDDAVWVAHVEERDIQSGDGALVISKLAP